MNQYLGLASGLLLLFGLFHLARRSAAKHIVRSMRKGKEATIEQERLIRAFVHNTRFWNSIFRPQPVGWGLFARRRLRRVYADADKFIQILNDRYADPSGGKNTRKSTAHTGSEAPQQRPEALPETEATDVETGMEEVLPEDSKATELEREEDGARLVH